VSAKTSIEWTEKTWNPVRGCSRISPGCENCYAEEIAGRFSKPGLAFEGFATREGGRGRWTRKVALVDDALSAPMTWREPSRVFVNSMSDLFHESLSDVEIALVFAVMAKCPQHTFQVLTKRADRMRAWFERIEGGREGEGPWPLPNVWLGVSVEDQKRADERIPHLLQTPAAVRFLSCEPLLGDVDITLGVAPSDACCGNAESCPDRSGACPYNGPRDANGDLTRIDWVVVGGESGHDARAFHVEWARSIVEQCRDANVAVFVKQLGAKPIRPPDGSPDDNGDIITLRSKKGGDPSEWPEDLRVREFPEVRA
jgi:protein gp37